MKNNTNIISFLIAALVAISSTIVVKFFIPEKNNVTNQTIEDLPMPEINFAPAKETQQEIFVLILTENINTDDVISSNSVTWKSWPKDAMQASYIAKDHNGSLLNNKDDYNQIMGMFAKHPLSKGIPITKNMLKQTKTQIKTTPIKKKKPVELVKPGMRAITVPIDQTSANARNLFKPGDIVDIAFHKNGQENFGNKKTQIIKYEAIKIIALDGETTQTPSTPQNKIQLSLGQTQQLPKYATLEIQEDKVDEMLKFLGTQGVILLFRPKSEPLSEDTKTDNDTIIRNKADDLIMDIMFNTQSTDLSASIDNKKKNDDLIKSMFDISTKDESIEITNNEKLKKIHDQNIVQKLWNSNQDDPILSLTNSSNNSPEDILNKSLIKDFIQSKKSENDKKLEASIMNVDKNDPEQTLKNETLNGVFFDTLLSTSKASEDAEEKLKQEQIHLAKKNKDAQFESSMLAGLFDSEDTSNTPHNTIKNNKKTEMFFEKISDICEPHTHIEHLSGEIINAKDESKDQKVVNIFRKLEINEIKLDKFGKVIPNSSENEKNPTNVTNEMTSNNPTNVLTNNLVKDMK